MIKRVQSILANAPLFNDLYSRNQQERREEVKKELKEVVQDNQTQISPLGKLFSDLEGIVDPQEIALKLRRASTAMGIAEVDLRKYVANKQFLTKINDKGGYKAISPEDRLPLLAKLMSYGNSCPAIAAINSKHRNGKCLIDFDSDDRDRTFRNEYVASLNRLRDFADRYSSLF